MPMGYKMYKFKLAQFLMCFLFSTTVCQDYTVTPIKTSSGLYYEKIGEVLLSNSNWQFVTSVDYKGYLLFYQYILQQANEIYTFCQTLNSSVCNDRYNAIQANLDRIGATDESMANFLGITTKPGRVKRFWSALGNFFKRIGGTIVRTIFGGGSSNVDLTPYNNAISNLQNGQQELQNQLFLQRTIFMIDSEKKNFQIDWLNKTHTELQNKINTLEYSFEKDKEEKRKELNELHKMLDEIQEKVKMQEEIQKRLSGKVNKIESDLLTVNKSIKDIKDKIANNTGRISKLEVINQLNTISIDFSNLMLQFETEQKTLYEVINNANRGNLDPYILTPLNLIEMLEDIQPNLPEGTKFPYYPSIESARKLYNIIEPSVYLFDYKIIFILKIPLVYSKTFNFYKITSLPQTVGENKFAFILPQEPFMIIDNNYQDYMLMSINNFKDFCKGLETYKYICKQAQEISHSFTSTECEVNLFKSPKQIPDSCNKRIMSLERSMFLQLQQSRTWIYVVPDTENLILSCNTDRNTLILTGSGFVHVNENCLVRTHNFELSFLVEHTKPVQSNFSPPLNLRHSIDLNQFGEVKAKRLKNTQIVFPFDLEKLEQVSYSVITEAKTSLAPLYYTLLVIIIGLVILFSYLVYAKKINFDKLRNMIQSMIVREQPAPILVQHPPNPENINMRIKVNNPDDIQKVSIYGKTSDTDPDSEYLTVRFKVKKDQDNLPTPQEQNFGNNYYNNEKKLPLPQKVNKEERYLNELRRMKPNVKY